MTTLAVATSGHHSAAADSLTLRCLEHERGCGSETLRLGLQLEGREQEVFYRIHGASIRVDADAWALLAVPLAMRLGKPLRLLDPISAQLAAAMRQLQEIYTCWYPHRMTAVPLEVSVRAGDPQPGAGGGAACFFSGGVDSFYCVRKHQTELTHLIFVHGFDIPLGNTALRKLVSDRVRQAADALGKPLLEVETNIRDVFDPHLMWGQDYLSVPMSVIPLLLGGTLRRCYLPSDVSYADMDLWGTHPLTTPLLSSPTVDIIHAGAEAERVDRLRALKDDPLAQQHLRVCWQNVEGEYNCGRCEKCVHDMCALRALRCLEQFPTFPRELDLKAVVALKRCWVHQPKWGFTLACAQEHGTDPELERALLAMRAAGVRAQKVRKLLNRLPGGVRRLGRAATGR